MTLATEKAPVQPSVESSDAVDSLIDSYMKRKEQLVSLLHDIQNRFNYLPHDVLTKVSVRLDIPLSQIFAVATFFRAFSLKPRGSHTITVCCGTACHVKGGARILQTVKRDLGIQEGGTTNDLKVTLEGARCLGACALAPLVVVDGKYYGQMNTDKLGRLIQKLY